jgi:hypothetical protein
MTHATGGAAVAPAGVAALELVAGRARHRLRPHAGAQPGRPRAAAAAHPARGGGWAGRPTQRQHGADGEWLLRAQLVQRLLVDGGQDAALAGGARDCRARR